MPFRRLAFFAIALASLVLVPSALAKPGSELEVYEYQTGLGQRAEIDIALHVASDRAPAAEAAIYVPWGYGLDLSRPIGGVLGVTHVTMWKGSTELSGKGTMVSADPKHFLGSRCMPTTASAAWLLKITIDGGIVQMPVFVFPGAFDGPGQASYVLRVCVPQPEKARGLRLVWLDLDTPTFRNPTTRLVYSWRADVTSFGVDGSPDRSTDFEVQTGVPIPDTIALTQHYDRKQGVVVVSGTVTGGGGPTTGVHVSTWTAPTRAFEQSSSVYAGAMTDAHGRFTLREPTRRSEWLYVTVDIAGGPRCGPSIGATCVYATTSPPPPVLRRLVVPPAKRN